MAEGPHLQAPDEWRSSLVAAVIEVIGGALPDLTGRGIAAREGLPPVRQL